MPVYNPAQEKDQIPSPDQEQEELQAAFTYTSWRYQEYLRYQELKLYPETGIPDELGKPLGEQLFQTSQRIGEGILSIEFDEDDPPSRIIGTLSNSYSNTENLWTATCNFFLSLRYRILFF